MAWSCALRGEVGCGGGAARRNVCSIREKSHGRRLAMCSRDVRKGGGEGISKSHDIPSCALCCEGLEAEDAGADISGAELQQYHNEGTSTCTEARRKA